jgi:hypothetical protein
LLPPVEQHPEVPEQEERSSDQAEPGHAARDETGLVHQVAQDQAVSERDDESGAEQLAPVLERSEREGRFLSPWKVVPKADDAEHEDDPRRDEDALDDSRRDVADGQGLVLPPRDRVENDRRSDVQAAR